MARHAKKFTKLVQKVYGKEQMVYNVHSVIHAQKLRIENHSANYFSTFAFEAMYSTLVSSLVAGK